MKDAEKNQRNSAERIVEELARCQRAKLLKLAAEIVPQITSDDILQPNDFPELEQHPVFRYEEGLLAGIESALIAIRAG